MNIRIFRALVIISLALSFSGCGWQLRGFGSTSVPQALALNTADSYAPIARQLQQNLMRRGFTLSATAPVQLYLSEEKRSKRTVAVTNIGATAQYELNISVDYAFNTTGAAPKLPVTINSQRVFDFIPGSNLAKIEEEQTLVEEMRQELINRILRNAPREAAHAAP